MSAAVTPGHRDTVAVSSVIVSEDRRRRADPRVVKVIAESVGRRGLLSPVRVRRDGRLVFGLHRLLAHERLGLTEINVVFVEADAKEVDIELDEIEENLARRDLTVLERAVAERRRKELYEQAPPETRRGVAGAVARHDLQAKAISFAEAEARGGSGERMVQQRVQIADKLGADALRLLDHEVANNHTQLVQLARLPEGERRSVMDLLASGQAKTVSQAKKAVAPPEVAVSGCPGVTPALEVGEVAPTDVASTIHRAAVSKSKDRPTKESRAEGTLINGACEFENLYGRRVRAAVEGDAIVLTDAGEAEIVDESVYNPMAPTTRTSWLLDLRAVVGSLPEALRAQVQVGEVEHLEAARCPICGDTIFRHRDGGCPRCEPVESGTLIRDRVYADWMAANDSPEAVSEWKRLVVALARTVPDRLRLMWMTDDEWMTEWRSSDSDLNPPVRQVVREALRAAVEADPRIRNASLLVNHRYPRERVRITTPGGVLCVAYWRCLDDGNPWSHAPYRKPGILMAWEHEDVPRRCLIANLRGADAWCCCRQAFRNYLHKAIVQYVGTATRQPTSE